MLLKYFYDESLAQASYLVGCQETREALVIDPARDVSPYMEAAGDQGLRIICVTETHIHADFVSGARELAARTGARLCLSGMGGADWSYGFADDSVTLLQNGDQIRLGNVLIDVIHTPGHTPEHLVFQLTDTANADRPMGIFTGDCLFVGDVGRPDLLETAANLAGTKEQGARDQFDNLRLFEALPDYLQIWPGHGAGSACGKALGAVPSSTLGYEKLFNPAFQFDDEEAFIEWLLEGQPETPRYFGQMKRVNREGPALLETLSQPGRLEGFILLEVVKAGALVIDMRPADEFSQAHAPGTLNIPPSGQFSTYAGWFVDYTRPVFLIGAPQDVKRRVRELRAIGVDNIPGYFLVDEVDDDFNQSLRRIAPEEAAARFEAGEAILLDVRSLSEYQSVHIEGAKQLMYGYLLEHLGELPADQPLILHCTSGARSQVAASLLQKYGFTNVASLSGGLDAWREAELPVVEG